MKCKEDNTMDYEEFKAMFTKMLSEAAHRADMTATKVNPAVINKESDYIGVVTKDEKYTINVSLEEEYRQFSMGRDIGEMSESIVKGIAPYISEVPVIPPYIKDIAESNLYLSAVNAKMNKELLKGIPYKKLDDLAIIPRIHIAEDRFGQANITLTEDIFKDLKLTKEEVLEIALANTEKQGINITPLSRVCMGIYEKGIIPDDEAGRELFEILEEEQEHEMMYVMTNDKKAEGAALMASNKAMERAYDRFGENFYVLPSSRHEVMLVPESRLCDGIDEDALRNIVKDVNVNAVTKKDYLSDSIYRYDHKTKCLSMVDSLEKTITEDVKVLNERFDQALKSPGRLVK